MPKQINVQLKKKNIQVSLVGRRGIKGDKGDKGDTGEIQNVPVQSVNGKIGDVELDKNDIGLENVDNTSDLNKPISTAIQTALDAKQGTITDSDDIAEGASHLFLTSTERTKLSNTSGANTGDQDLTGLVPKTTTVNGHALSGNVTVSKSDVGLGNVDNTSDANKPVSTAVQTQINTKVGRNGDTSGELLIDKPFIRSGRSDFIVSAGTLFEDFENIADFTLQSASGSFSADTTHFKTGTQGIKLTAGSTTDGFIDKVLNTTISSSGKVGFWVYVPSLVGLTNVVIFLSSSTNYSKYFTRSFPSTLLHEGWNYLSVKPDTWSIIGGATWSDTFLRLRIRVGRTAGFTPSVTFDSMNIARVSRPKCLVTFDDGWDSSYSKGFDYMKTLNIPGTQYMIKGRVGTPSYLTLDQCKELYESGWDLGTHGDINLTSLPTQAAQEAEIDSNLQFLIDNNFMRAAYHYAYPNGGYNDSIRNALANLKFKTARTIIDRPQGNVLDEPYLITRQGIYNSTTVTAFKSYLDQAIGEGSAILFNFHIIVDSVADVGTKVLTADFKQMMDYVALKRDQGLVDLTTIGEWYNGLSGYLPAIPTQTNADINVKSHKVTNVADPINPQDAATKNYVDNIDNTGITRSINTVTAPFTGGSTATTDYVYLLNTGAVYTQPTAIGNTNRYTLKNISASNMAIASISAQTFDGGSLTIAPNESIDIISDNTNWRII